MNKQKYEVLIKNVRKVLESFERPLIFFDDDVDGLTSFLLLWRHLQKGKGTPLKGNLENPEGMLRYAQEYGADAIVILDIANVSSEFFDSCNIPIIWIDHHQHEEQYCNLAKSQIEMEDIPSEKIIFFDPLVLGLEPFPTAYWVYEIIGKPEKDLFLCELGVVSDWQIIDSVHLEAVKKYPLLYKNNKMVSEHTAPLLLFSSPLGELIQILTFNLKGKSSDVKKSVVTLTRIDDYQDILQQKTSAGTFIIRRSKNLLDEYKKIVYDAIKSVDDSKVLVYTYSNSQTSVTSYLSNELLYRFPEKVIVVGRCNNEAYRCSLRSSPSCDLRAIINSFIDEIDGQAGGHAQALGANIASHDFIHFIEELKKRV